MRSTATLFVVLFTAAGAAALGCQPPAAEQRAKPAGSGATSGTGASQVVDDAAAESVPLESIKPGTRLDPDALPPHTHIVFRSKPKVSSGDVDKVGTSIRNALETFTTLVIVETEPDPARAGKFRRAAHRTGIGKPATKPGETGDLVLTKDTAKEFGVGLGLFERKLLVEREKELATVRSPGASATSAMFDFAMMFQRDGKRVPITVRYLSLVDDADGDLTTAYWVLDPVFDAANEPTGYSFVGDSLYVLPANHLMDWEMHVDGDNVTFGAPNADAFTSTKLPEATPKPVPDDFKAAATKRAYGTNSGTALEQRVRALLKK